MLMLTNLEHSLKTKNKNYWFLKFEIPRLCGNLPYIDNVLELFIRAACMPWYPDNDLISWSWNDKFRMNSWSKMTNGIGYVLP